MARPLDSLFPGETFAPPAVDGAPSPKKSFGELFLAITAEDSARYHYLLLFRFILVNVIGFALLGVAYLEGWIGTVLAADFTNLSLTIAVVFFCGLTTCAIKTWQTSRELNLVRSKHRPRSSKVAMFLKEIEGRDANSRATSAAVHRLKLSSRIAGVRHAAGSLVLLGLIGTVIGFIIALSGVQPNAASDPSAIGPMVATLIDGMSIALYTTLVGAVFNIWLMINYNVLAMGTVNLVTATVELGERLAKH